MEGFKILCVDDDVDVLDSLVSIIEMEGHTVIRAENGEQALELFAKHGNDLSLVLTDIRMPGMDGLQLAREIRKTSEVPIVVLSAYLADAKDCDDVRINGFLTKPYGIQPVMNVIKEYAASKD